MKITAILLLAVCLQVSAKSYSQITLKEKNAPLTKLFRELKKQSGFDFLYSATVIKEAGSSSVELNNVSLQYAIEECLKGKQLTYTIVATTVIIRKKEEPEPVERVVEEKTTNDVSGRVTDSEGNPLSDASVKVKGTTLGTTTNADGVFVLKGVDENATLVFSYAEHDAVEVKINGRTNVIVTLKRTESNLQEVVINKGYYTERQKFSVGNVGKVTAKDIEKQPVNNPLLALQGRVPGLFISQSTGLPGAGVTVRVEGQNSLNRGNDPLYVIDGVPYMSQLLPNLGNILGVSEGYGQANGNPLSFINPSDIESIEILKDADATAIYGSRAANGAILITTKKGKSGKLKVDFVVQTGLGMVPTRLDLLNTKQYLEMRREAKRNDNAAVRSTDYDINGTWDTTTRYKDWQKELIGGTARYTDVQANISGGGPIIQYLFGANYHKETTVYPGEMSDQKGAVHFNINTSSINKKFLMQLSANYMLDKNQLMGADLTRFAMSLAPNAPDLLNADGTLNWATTSTGTTTWGDNGNPLAYLFNRYINQTTNLISSSSLKYQLLTGLNLIANFGYNTLQTDEVITIPLVLNAPADRPFVKRSANYGFNNVTSWIAEPQVNFSRKFGDFKVDGLIGLSFQQQKSKRRELNGSGHLSDEVLEDVRSAATITVPVNGTVDALYKYSAAFSRININWNEKLILNSTIRRDGSSRFGTKTQLHDFGSIGAAWIFSNEKLFKSWFPVLSFGKLKGSYGTTGNDQIGDYQFLNQYTTLNPGVPYQGVAGLVPDGIPNPYLAWEETKKLYAGINLGFFDNKLIVDAGYSRNRSSSQLMFYAIPNFTGAEGLLKNFPATIENTSWEFATNGTIVRNSNLEWSMNFNLTLPNNKLIEFAGLASSSYANTYTIGQPFTITRVNQFIGVDPATGKNLFTSALKDRVQINLSPKYYGGFGSDIRFRSFDLGFLFQFVKQVGPNYFFGRYPGIKNYNQPSWILGRWQKPGDVTSIARYNTDFSIYPSSASLVDAGYSDASYIRLKNISLSWLAPEKFISKLKLASFKVFVHGQNLLTATKYLGLDPETRSSDRLPPLRVISFGCQVSF